VRERRPLRRQDLKSPLSVLRRRSGQASASAKKTKRRAAAIK
jgi:hypothetical protein